MDVEHIRTFLEKLGCYKIRTGGTVIRAACPFEGRHSKGVDNSPSFAVKIGAGRESTWNCKACDIGGSLEALVSRLDKERRFKTSVLKELNDFIVRHDRISTEQLKKMTEAAKYGEPKAKEVAGVTVSVAPPKTGRRLVPVDLELPTIPDEHLEQYFALPDEEALAYLHGPERHLNDRSIKEWELRWSPQQKRVAVPVRDCKGRLVGISGRATEKWRQPKYLHSKGFRRDYYLYGENKLGKSGHGYIVEGQFDVIGLWQYGYRNVVAILGSHLTQFQAEKVVQFFSDVVIVADGDDAGREAASRFEEALRPRLSTVRVVTLPDDEDPGSISRDTAIELLGPPEC